MGVTREEFRRWLGSFAAGVTVVTTRSPAGMPYGLTVTAFTSVSLDPPLVLVCVDKKSESHPHFLASRVFAVNFLAAEQEELSRRFAVSGGDKFQGVTFSFGRTGAPLLAGALGFVESEVEQEVDAGDHTIFIGRVVAGHCVDDKRPLLYFRGRYYSV
ncbi:MAG: flavin reductase family protein [Candidatus Binatia bacterium]|nr:flavin reductase family protein [Candidatus Binatia bacterium]